MDERYRRQSSFGTVVCLRLVCFVYEMQVGCVVFFFFFCFCLFLFEVVVDGVIWERVTPLKLCNSASKCLVNFKLETSAFSLSLSLSCVSPSLHVSHRDYFHLTSDLSACELSTLLTRSRSRSVFRSTLNGIQNLLAFLLSRSSLVARCSLLAAPDPAPAQTEACPASGNVDAVVVVVVVVISSVKQRPHC